METQMPIHNNVLVLCLYALLILSTFLEPSLSSELCHPEDKIVLLRIQTAFRSPHGLSSWDPQTDCCDWSGINCDENTGRVYSLFVKNVRTIAGLIPPEVGDLPYLESLDFHKCPDICGLIPLSIVKLKNLKRLMITNCNVSGLVPEFLSKMESLEFISFAFNRIGGQIPSSLATLPNLRGLGLDRNQLTGPIPDAFGSFMGEGFHLDLSHNKLSGEIPASLGNKKDFTYIDLSRNKLEGDATPLFGAGKKMLYHLDLSRNLLSFDFSAVRFPETLVNLDINHNKISGVLPPELTGLSLQTFNVSYNRLCGRIPVGGRLQTNFNTTAYFHNRCLCGAPLSKCNI